MERTLDAKGRWRNRTVGFRVSEEEAKMIDRMVALSGLTKQEYILRKLMDWEVTVQGNPRVYKALKNPEHRLIYSVHNDMIEIYIFSMKYHYSKK